MRQALLWLALLGGILMERLSTPPRRGRPPKGEADTFAQTVADRVRRELAGADGKGTMDIIGLAVYLKCSPSLIRLEISRQNRGRGRLGLPFLRVGRLIRFRKADIDRWLDSRAIAALPGYKGAENND